MLKAGRVLALGEKSKTLDSNNLSRAFGARMRLQAVKSRYKLTVKG